MLNNLSAQQFGDQTSANSTAKTANGQSASSSSSSSNTTTVISVKGSAPSISTRSS